MKHCANPECSFALKHQRAASYGEHAQTCSDCGQTLTSGEADAAVTLPVGLGLSFQPRARPLNVEAWVLSIALPAALLLFGFVSFFPQNGRGDSALSLFNLSYSAESSLFAVNITPFLFALILVEIATTIVPGWRQLRESEAGRRRMLLIALGLGGVLILAHAGLMAVALSDLQHSNDVSTAEVAASFVGTVLVAIASVAVGLMVSRRFRLNGFAVISLLLSIVALLSTIVAMVESVENGLMAPVQAIIAAGTCGVVALLATRVFDERPLWSGRRATPVVGATWSHYPVVAVAAVSLGLIVLPLQTAIVILSGDIDATTIWIVNALPWIRIVITGVAFFVLARVFWPTARIARAAAAFTDAPPSDIDREVRVGVKDRLVKEGVLVAVILFIAFGYRASPSLPSVSTYLFVVAAVAFAKDLRQEVRVERTFGEVVYVGQLTRVWEASVLQEAWARQGHQGPLHVRGVHYRSLFQFFAPEVFLDVFAKEEDVDAVREQIERLRAANANT